MIGAPGRTRCWIVASSTGRTEVTRRTCEASTSQPKRRFWNSAVAPAMRGSSQVGWYPSRPSSIAPFIASATSGAVPKSISATHAPIVGSPLAVVIPVHFREPVR